MARINVSYTSDSSEMFLQVQEEGTLRVFDYGVDSEEIHRICGGRQYYRSRSGMSGEGWIESYRNLIPVGYYHTDVVNVDGVHPIEVAEGISVMLPYQAHTQGWAYPVVVTRTVEFHDERGDVIVYAALERLAEVVKALYLGKEDELGEVRDYAKKFVDEQGHTSEVGFKFINIWGDRSFNPWNFMTHKLQKFICDEWAGVWGNFRLTRLSENVYCRKHCFAGKYYRGEKIEGLTDDTFYEGGETLAAFVPDWEFNGTVARRSTRNGQGYRVVMWSNPENYREIYAPKILFYAADSLDELKALMGMEEEEV